MASPLHQGPSEPEFYGDLVYKFKKIVGSYHFSAQLNKMIYHFKKNDYSIDVLQQTACLVVNKNMVVILLSSLIARLWVGLQII